MMPSVNYKLFIRATDGGYYPCMLPCCGTVYLRVTVTISVAVFCLTYGMRQLPAGTLLMMSDKSSVTASGHAFAARHHVRCEGNNTCV